MRKKEEEEEVQFLSLVDYLFFVNRKKSNVLWNHWSVTLEFFNLDINSSYQTLSQWKISDNKMLSDNIFSLRNGWHHFQLAINVRDIISTVPVERRTKGMPEKPITDINIYISFDSTAKNNREINQALIFRADEIIFQNLFSFFLLLMRIFTFKHDSTP